MTSLVEVVFVSKPEGDGNSLGYLSLKHSTPSNMDVDILTSWTAFVTCVKKWITNYTHF